MTIQYAASDLVSLRDFGATLNGVANDLTPFVNCCAAIQAAGGGVMWVPPNSTVNLGNISGATTLASLSGLKSFGIASRGSKFLINTTSGLNTVLSVTNTPKTFWDGFEVEDTGFDPTATWTGIRFISLATSGNGVNYHGHYFGPNLRFYHCVAGMICETDGGTSRIRGIRFDGPEFDHCYYGLNLANNGDKVSGHINIDTARRAWILFGVTGVDLSILYNHDGTASYTSNGDTISRSATGFDTKAITLRAKITGTPISNPVVFEDQSNPAAGVLRDIDVTLDLSEATHDGGITPFVFRSINVAAGSCTTIFDGITLRGNLGPWGEQSNSQPLFTFTNWPATEGKLSIGADLLKAISAGAPCHFPGFAVKTSATTELRTKSGDLTSGNVTIPLARYDGRSFCLKVRTYAVSDHSAAAAQAMMYEERVIQGFNASGGNVSIQQDDSLHHVYRTTDNTVTCTASGENILVTFGAYSGANAFARVEVEHLRGMI